MAGNMDERVKIRLIKFLLKDKLGIRKYLLKLFLQAKSCTTGEVYDYLLKQGFNVNSRSVSAMVGQMHSRLGILRVDSINKRNVYTLKENYLDIVKMVLTPFTTGI